MVSWNQLQGAISENAERTFIVSLVTHTCPSVTYERFPIVRLPPVQQLVVAALVPAPQLQISSEEEDDLIQPPPPSSRPTIKVPVANEFPAFLEPSPKLPSPKPAAVSIAAPVVRPLLEPKTSKRAVDPLVVGIQDVMYIHATYRVQYQIECEEAVRLETEMPIVYKSQCGRSRGWTKTNLEILIKPRCAIGGNLRDLDKAKATFHWNLVRTDKYQAAFLDFVCIAKKIRIAVWFTDEKRVVLYPAADHTDSLDSELPLHHVTSSGFERHGLRTGAELSKFCATNNWVLVPPASVYHAMSHLKLDELANVARSLGMGDMEGNKQERVERIVSYKLHQRLCAKNI
jgi:hypothetical protein